jgi:threonine synthase
LALKVTDEEIIAAIKELASFTGIFAEPAAAASYAGLLKGVAEHKIAPDEVIVLLITGSGLKDIPSAGRAVKIPPPIECDLAEIEKYV